MICPNVVRLGVRDLVCRTLWASVPASIVPWGCVHQKAGLSWAVYITGLPGSTCQAHHIFMLQQFWGSNGMTTTKIKGVLPRKVASFLSKVNLLLKPKSAILIFTSAPTKSRLSAFKSLRAIKFHSQYCTADSVRWNLASASFSFILPQAPGTQTPLLYWCSPW